MGQDLHLRAADCCSAAAVQDALDRVAQAGGGAVVLPALELELDRGLELRSGTELRGQGERTVLRKAPGRVYPLTGYHNYGMCDVPLATTAGLAPGMTVAVYDRPRRGFYSTFARLTWVESGWVGLDHGLEADYAADQEPVLTTAFPLVFGHGIGNAAVRDLVLLGGRETNLDCRMDGCRGGSIYFARSHDLEITGVREAEYNGEGLSFQMCRQVHIRHCQFTGNTGNGMHPGAGSTAACFEDCVGDDNLFSGFFFCVRASRITVRRCEFRNNAEAGISIGTRDCHNLVEACTIEGNGGPGVLCRAGAPPTEVHSCRIVGNRFIGNARRTGAAEIVVQDAAHDLVIARNLFRGEATPARAAVLVGPAVRGVFLEENSGEGLGSPEGPAAAFTATAPAFTCGYESAVAAHFRHLSGDGAGYVMR
jgi:hypothetical protein